MLLKQAQKPAAANRSKISSAIGEFLRSSSEKFATSRLNLLNEVAKHYNEEDKEVLTAELGNFPLVFDRGFVTKIEKDETTNTITITITTLSTVTRNGQNNLPHTHQKTLGRIDPSILDQSLGKSLQVGTYLSTVGIESPAIAEPGLLVSRLTLLAAEIIATPEEIAKEYSLPENWFQIWEDERQARSQQRAARVQRKATTVSTNTVVPVLNQDVPY